MRRLFVAAVVCAAVLLLPAPAAAGAAGRTWARPPRQGRASAVRGGAAPTVRRSVRAACAAHR